MSQGKKSEKRCNGCGEVFCHDDKVIRISLSKIDQKKTGEEWGTLHYRCFLRSMRSPKAAMEELALMEGDECV